ncbi:MAG: hypothetical protein ACSHYA_09015 [Opitutaceae bacterium]
MKKSALLLLSLPSLLFGAATEYTLTNITGWSDAQLAALPHFDRYMTVKPIGATADFTPTCVNGLGLVAGNRSDSNGDEGAVVIAGSQSAIGAWGRWNWSYWVWDGRDNHYYSGSLERSPVSATNVLGQVVGYASLPGGSSDFATRNDWDDHTYLYDAATGEKSDLTPAADRSIPGDLNDRSEVTGYWSDASAYHPFRRSADGSLTDLVFDEPFSHFIAPAVINNLGHIVGQVTVWTTPRDYIPFISESGSNTIPLPYPDELNDYKAGIADINDHDVIVGYYHKADTPLETTALRWTKQSGDWVAEELIELIDDNMDFILDRAIAVNDAGYIICSGHSDDGPDDTFNTHRFLLTPNSFPVPATVTLTPTNLSATGATLRAKINPSDLTTSAQIDHGLNTAYGASEPLASSSGTLPLLAEVTLTNLSPHTTYHYRATATNASGTTTAEDQSFTTPWDWSSWATANLSSSNPDLDSNNNGQADLIDYATGNHVLSNPEVNGSSAQMTFRRSLDADGVQIIVQVSHDLVNWNDGSTYQYGSGSSSNSVTTEVTRTADGSDGEMVTVSSDMTGMDPVFFRLKVLGI